GAGATQVEYTRTLSGDLLSAYDGTTAKYYEPDALGSTDALADQSQSPVDRWDYRGFGTPTQTLGADTTPFLWVGRKGYYRDSETELFLLGSGTRYYDSVTAKFLSHDPLDFLGGDVNLYRYVNNRPLVIIDPSGMMRIRPLFGNLNLS